MIRIEVILVRFENGCFTIQDATPIDTIQDATPIDIQDATPIDTFI